MNVEVRPLTAEDRSRVLEISSLIWDGDDWVPDALDSWFGSEEGQAVAAVLDGRLIGFARRAWILPGHAWFEALRSDPAARGCGAGRAITEHLIDGARRDGAEAIHLSTYIDNEASITSSSRTAFDGLRRSPTSRRTSPRTRPPPRAIRRSSVSRKAM